MSHKHSKAIENRLDESKPVRYYDANTLSSKECQKEITNCHQTGFRSATSSLAIGEAVKNIIEKSTNEAGKEKVCDFVEMIAIQAKARHLNILSAKGIRAELTFLGSIAELDIPDACHLAIAIKNRCESVASADRDLFGISKQTIEKIRAKYGIPGFRIERKKIDD